MKMYLPPEQWRLEEILYSDWKRKKNGIIMVNLKGSLATTETIVFDVS